MSLRVRHLAVGLSAILLTACGQATDPISIDKDVTSPAAQIQNTPERRRIVAVYLLQKAQTLAPAYPELRLFNLRYADDLTLVCGYLVAPGEEPLLFASSDTSPDTIDRPIGMPNLGRAGNWRDPRQEAGQVRMARQCARMGLTPALPDVTLIAPAPSAAAEISAG